MNDRFQAAADFADANGWVMGVRSGRACFFYRVQVKADDARPMSDVPVADFAAAVPMPDDAPHAQLGFVGRVLKLLGPEWRVRIEPIVSGVDQIATGGYWLMFQATHGKFSNPAHTENGDLSWAALLAATPILRRRNCAHEWTDLKNTDRGESVESGTACLKCGTLGS